MASFGRRRRRLRDGPGRGDPGSAGAGADAGGTGPDGTGPASTGAGEPGGLGGAGGGRSGGPRAQARVDQTGPAEERDGERGLRGLIGSGASQLSVGTAMRARDAARPTEADLAEAEENLVVIRRNWVPREDLPRSAPPAHHTTPPRSR